MLLVVDTGNTNITFGVFEECKLIKIARIVTDIEGKVSDYKSLINEAISGFNITECAISSVVDEINSVIEQAVSEIWNIRPLVLTPKHNIGMKIKTKYPETVGMDRIANVCGARVIAKPAIVIDMGSCTTFDIIDSNGDFSGGIIIPGIRMQLKSLKDNTSKLPLIEPKEIDSVIGNDTESCILSGVIRGHAYAITGLIDECAKELGSKPVIIATGGFSELMSKYVKFDYIRPNLTLDGIKELYSLQN